MVEAQLVHPNCRFMPRRNGSLIEVLGLGMGCLGTEKCQKSVTKTSVGNGAQ